MKQPGSAGPLTAAGWTLLGGCLGVYALGWWLGYRVLVLLAAGGLVVLLTASVLVVLPLRVDLTWTVQPDRVRVDEPAWGRLVVRNLARWPTPGFVAVDQMGGGRVEVVVPVIARAGNRTLQYPIPARRRGRLRQGPLMGEHGDPLGLFRRTQRLADERMLWVHPRVHRARPLPVGSVPDFEGRQAETARSGAMTFSSIREYELGDDPRRIHWRSTARTGRLMVREHVDTTDPTTTVVLDTRSAALTTDGFEHAVEVVASVVDATLLTGMPARLLVPAQDEIQLAAAGAESLLDRLAAAEQHDGDVTGLLYMVKRVPPGGALVVVTGAGESLLLAKLSEQRRRFSPVVVVTVLAEHDEPVLARRHRGMVVLAGRTGAEAVAAWDRMVLGESK